MVPELIDYKELVPLYNYYNLNYGINDVTIMYFGYKR